MNQFYVNSHAKIKLTSFFLMFTCLSFWSLDAQAKISHHNYKNSPQSIKKHTHSTISHHSLNKITDHSPHNSHSKIRKIRYRHRLHRKGHVIQCVAFVRNASDIQLKGNAGDWWNNAEGIYERGYIPQPDSVLSFKSTRHMPYGHVALVTKVINSRMIMIDQSHWAQRGISRNTPVIDVSPNNDWSAVRVGLNKNKNSFGSIYPTHGFIYPNQISTSTHQNIHQSATIKTWTANAENSNSYSTSKTQVALAPNISEDFLQDGPDHNIQ